ncbi:MAG: N-acetyl-gamma-glutamyl-phosphate reductase [Desulfobulbia bacterium]
MVRVGIVGASGYTGAELARILCNHPEVEIAVATSRQYAGKPLSQVFPSLQGRADIVCEDLPVETLVQRADFFFTAVPHQTAMDIVPQLVAAGKKVVDLSADFRIHDAQVYEQWYQAHSAKDLLATAVYGLPELHRASIRNTQLVANPGCYPTSVILGLAPLLKAGLVDPQTIIIDSKSGVSGAGRAAQVGSLYCEVADGFKAYKVGEHRHTPEIEQELGGLCGQPVTVSFTPHLVPMSRGILSTIYAKAVKPLSGLTELYQDYYKEEEFVRVCAAGQYPATQYIRGSNYCDIGVKFDPRTGRVIILSAIDNVVKGASGQAVQNMNLMCGFPENTGLRIVPLFP